MKSWNTQAFLRVEFLDQEVSLSSVILLLRQEREIPTEDHDLGPFEEKAALYEYISVLPLPCIRQICIKFLIH